MGKETKVGLAVIAVLMTVFGVLLFRHLQASHKEPTRGLGDQTAVKPLPTHGDVTVASDESRITGSKLWETPGDQQPKASVDVAAAGATDPYGAEAPASAAAAPESAVVTAGAPRERGNPLRRASAEFPVEAGEQAADKSGDEIVADPLMSVPTSSDAAAAPPASADPYAGQEAAPADEPLPAYEAMEPPVAASPAVAPNAAAMRSPFDQAPPAAEPAQAPKSAPSEPVWADAEPPVSDLPNDIEPPQQAPPQNAFDDQPVSQPQYDAEPQYDAAPQRPASQFDRFESTGVEPSTDEAATEPPAADEWRTSGAPAAAPLAAAPLAADASEAAPLPIQDGLYTVQPGDSLWSVSEAVYGTGGYFKALAAHNRAMLPKTDKLTVGSQLSVPPVDDLQRDYPSLCPRPRKSAVVKAGATRASAVQPRSGRDVYIVNEGDTLFTIARYELGKATRWAEIYDLNREALGDDFDYLRPGMELVMPAGGAEAASQPAASRY